MFLSDPSSIGVMVTVIVYVTSLVIVYSGIYFIEPLLSVAYNMDSQLVSLSSELEDVHVHANLI